MTDPLDDLVALYEGPEAQVMYDEVVTELQHAEQCAAMAAEQGAPPHLVAAALLHDVGHLVVLDNVPLGEELERDAHHERAGATHLRRWFGPEVTEPVRLHVAAKRYLCAADADYLAHLTPSSERSLRVQGGVMSPTEVAAFEAEPWFEGATSVRRWDDDAKVAELDVPAFATSRALLASLSH